jgi:ribosome-associated protein
MIEITSTIQIDENELHLDLVRSSGPGGQNVNKVATAVQLRFDVRNSPSLAPDVKERLLKLAGSRATDEGVLVIEAKRFRTQDQNRLDALQRLINLVQKAAVKPRLRRATRPTLTAKAARVDSKKRRGQVKRTRRFNPEDWEN